MIRGKPGGRTDYHAAVVSCSRGIGIVSCPYDLIWDRSGEFLFQKAYPCKAESKKVFKRHITSGKDE